MKWSYDMDAAKDGLARLVAFLSNDGSHRIGLSRWLPPQKDRPEGRWEFFTVGNPPYAWAEWPEAPTPIRALPDGGAAVDALLDAGWTPEQIVAEGLAVMLVRG